MTAFITWILSLTALFAQKITAITVQQHTRQLNRLTQVNYTHTLQIDMPVVNYRQLHTIIKHDIIFVS